MPTFNKNEKLLMMQGLDCLHSEYAIILKENQITDKHSIHEIKQVQKEVKQLLTSLKIIGWANSNQ